MTVWSSVRQTAMPLGKTSPGRPAVGVSVSDSGRRRSASLDGLRGLAAASVVALHLISVFLDTSFPQYATFDRWINFLDRTPVSVLWAGVQAVPLFFILSGFALHRMLSTAMSYQSFAVRRLIRLWTPYIVTIISATIGIYLGGSHKIAGQSPWLNGLIGTTLTKEMLANHLVMIGFFDTRPIDFVVWSLVLEVRLSLLFPLINWAIVRLHTLVMLAFSLTISVIATYLQHRSEGSSISICATLASQSYFVIGALISRHEAQIQCRYGTLPKWVKIVLAGFALILYCDCLRLSATYSTMLGASWLLIMCLCSSRLHRVLLSPLPQFLGRISYSLYLSHAVILLLMINLLYPYMSFVLIVLLSLPIAICISTILYYLVEKPAINLSRIAGRHLQF
jgi:peptidoglycan/LPS O-acetylase OafA/YrhL